MVSFVVVVFFTRQNYELFYKFKTNQVLVSSISLSIYCHFYYRNWFANQTKFKTVLQEMEKEELNECLTMF